MPKPLQPFPADAEAKNASRKAAAAAASLNPPFPYPIIPPPWDILKPPANSKPIGRN